MAVDKIDIVDDPRVQKKSTVLNGRNYGYLLAEPKGQQRATIFLIHGFPDLSATWRYQIPMLLDLGLRVVAPDCMGYGRTDAPPYKLSDYTFKHTADDFAELARQLGYEKIILGGHDWGGMVVYRFAEYYPSLVTHVFSICTPYMAPQTTYIPLHIIVTSYLPNFTYQLDLAGGALEEALTTRDAIKGFLNGAYGARGPNKEVLIKRNGKVAVENIGLFKSNPLCTDAEMEFYADEYARHGVYGPLNWYRTREANYMNDLALIDAETGKQNQKIQQPTLFVVARKDLALPPAMSGGMERYFAEGRLTKRDVDAGHWCLWEKAEEANELIRGWIEGVVFGGKSKL